MVNQHKMQSAHKINVGCWIFIRGTNRGGNHSVYNWWCGYRKVHVYSSNNSIDID
jgi:hypothetical protein